MRGSLAGVTSATASDFGISYEHSNSGEAKWQPQVRSPPMREHGKHLASRLQGIMTLRRPASATEPEDEPILDIGDMYLLFDGRVSSHDKPMLKAFTGVVVKKQTQLTVMYDEASLRRRKEKSRGVATIKQVRECSTTFVIR